MDKVSDKIEEVKKILKEIHPEDSDKELEGKATNLWEIALFLVRHQVKEHSNTAKTQNTEVLKTLTVRSPPENLTLFKTQFYRRDEFY